MSKTTSGFEEWFGDNEPDDFEDIYALYNAASSRETFGTYEVKTSGEKTFITGPISTLALLSEKARTAFLAKIEDLKDDPDMDMESWYGFKRAISKDD